MTPEEVYRATLEMRDQAAAKVKQFSDADDDDEISELNYYNGQRVALNQVLSWIKTLTPPPTTLS